LLSHASAHTRMDTEDVLAAGGVPGPKPRQQVPILGHPNLPHRDLGPRWMVASPGLGIVVVSTQARGAFGEPERRVVVYQTTDTGFTNLRVWEGVQACRALFGDATIAPAFLGPDSPVLVATAGNMFPDTELKLVDARAWGPLAFLAGFGAVGEVTGPLAATATAVAALVTSPDSPIPRVCVRFLGSGFMSRVLVNGAGAPRQVWWYVNNAVPDGHAPVLDPQGMTLVQVPQYYVGLRPDFYPYPGVCVRLHGLHDDDDTTPGGVKVHLSWTQCAALVRHDVVTVRPSATDPTDPPVNLVTLLSVGLPSDHRDGALPGRNSVLLRDGGLLVPSHQSVRSRGALSIVPPQQAPGHLVHVDRSAYWPGVDGAPLGFVSPPQAGPAPGYTYEDRELVAAMTCRGRGVVVFEVRATRNAGDDTYGCTGFLTLWASPNQVAQARMSAVRVGWMVAVHLAAVSRCTRPGLPPPPHHKRACR